MKICVLGLGYVGSVMTGCLAEAGHAVIGVDVKPEKTDTLNSGRTPVVEPGLDELITKGHAAGLISATSSTADAVSAADLSFVCVGTPPLPDGSIDTSTVEAVCREIGAALAGVEGTPTHTVVIRSTVMPGSVARCEQAIAEASGRSPGEGFTLCLNPELLREGSAIADFMNPPFTVVGARQRPWAEPLRELYRFLAAPFLVTEPENAEALKMVCNVWHAAKVCFANEVGRLCSANEIDAQAVMELFAKDEKLNLSASYLKPGFAYGGSCLPKDLGALIHLARRSQVELPLIEGLPRSNTLHVERAKSLIVASNRRRIGFLGLSFKQGTDDLRGSPQLDLVEFCVGKGFAVRIYDPCVRPDRLMGRNRDVALERLGHLADLLVSSPEVLDEQSDLLVLGHHDAAFADFCRALPARAHVIDLVGLLRPDELEASCVTLC